MNTTPSNTNVGSAILALSGMLNSTFRRKPTAKMVQCRIALEKNGVIRPVADRIKSGKALSAPAYKQFATLAKTDKGAATVVELAGKLADRVVAINAYKASQKAAEVAA